MNFLRTNLRVQSGQALLIVVLVMVVALTVTLSVVSRSVVNLKTSVQQTDSQKALAAAEAGVEQAIKNQVDIGTGTSRTFVEGTPYSAKITQVNGALGFLVNGGTIVSRDDGAYIWLSPYDKANPWSRPWSGDLTIYWGDNPVEVSNAAIEVVVISGPNSNTATIKRYAYDPASERTGQSACVIGTNCFDSGYPPVYKGEFGVSGKTFTYKTTISGISNGLLARVNPIYFSTYMGALGTPALPDQGEVITATGGDTTNGSVQRKVTVFQGYPILAAELFPYSLLVPIKQ